MHTLCTITSIDYITSSVVIMQISAISQIQLYGAFFSLSPSDLCVLESEDRYHFSIFLYFLIFLPSHEKHPTIYGYHIDEMTTF